MTSWLVEWKDSPEMQWLKDAPSQPLQQSLKDLESAYSNFFAKMLGRSSFGLKMTFPKKGTFRLGQCNW